MHDSQQQSVPTAISLLGPKQYDTPGGGINLLKADNTPRVSGFVNIDTTRKCDRQRALGDMRKFVLQIQHALVYTFGLQTPASYFVGPGFIFRREQWLYSVTGGKIPGP
jgi:hypothetical protein